MKTEKKIIVLALFCFLVVPICAAVISSYFFSRGSNAPVEIRKN